MGTMTHAAGRLAFSAAIDVALKDVRKNREEGIIKLVDLMEKYMSGEKLDVNYDKVREMIRDKDCTLNKYMNRIIDEPSLTICASINHISVGGERCSFCSWYLQPEWNSPEEIWIFKGY